MPTWKNNYWNNSPKHYHILLAFFYICQFLEWFNTVPSQFFPPHLQNSQKTSSTNKHGLSLEAVKCCEDATYLCFREAQPNYLSETKPQDICYQLSNTSTKKDFPPLHVISHCSNFPQNSQYFFFLKTWTINNKAILNFLFLRHKLNIACKLLKISFTSSSDNSSQLNQRNSNQSLMGPAL